MRYRMQVGSAGGVPWRGQGEERLGFIVHLHLQISTPQVNLREMLVAKIILSSMRGGGYWSTLSCGLTVTFKSQQMGTEPSFSGIRTTGVAQSKCKTFPQNSVLFQAV